jgi:hypothetical protein
VPDTGRAGNDFRRHPNGNGTGRHILKHNGIGSNEGVISDQNRAKNLCSGPDVHPIANGWGTRNAGSPESDRDPMPKHHIVSNHCISANHDSPKMFNQEAPPNLDLTGEIDASDDLAEQFQNPVDEGQRFPQ